ncbi:MAG: YidH family protein [Solirubrobacteraceae bacterium]
MTWLGMGDLDLRSDPDDRPGSAAASVTAAAEERPHPSRGPLTGAFAEHRLEEVGEEPDPRFTFANERTFLAWNRTALALIAAGLAAAQFLHFNLPGLRLVIALPLIVLGAALSVRSYRHWVDSERAMRLGRPLGYSEMPRVLAGGITLIAVVGAVVAIIDRIVY